MTGIQTVIKQYRSGKDVWEYYYVYVVDVKNIGDRTSGTLLLYTDSKTDAIEHAEYAAKKADFPILNDLIWNDLLGSEYVYG